MAISTVERIPIEGYEQWLALRQPVITASDVATVCGEGAFASAAVLFAEKKGLRPPLIDSPTLKKGRWGEASAFEALSETFPDIRVRRIDIILLGFGISCVAYYAYYDGVRGALAGGLMYVMVVIISVWML